MSDHVLVRKDDLQKMYTAFHAVAWCNHYWNDHNFTDELYRDKIKEANTVRNRDEANVIIERVEELLK